ncbi:60S ribosomal protein L1 [Spatholobus suberectus]|nr:60S ribosomal protein L1 [Spatholobus suberectus]
MALLAEAQSLKAKKEKLDKKCNIVSKEEASAIKADGKAWYIKPCCPTLIMQNLTTSLNGWF